MPFFMFSPFSRLLHQSAKLAAPSPETCSRIFKAVVKTSQTAESAATSYASAISKADRLFKKAKINIAVQAAAVGTGITMAATVASISPATLNAYVNSGGGFVRQAEVVITAEGMLPFATVTILPDNNGAPIAASRRSDSSYTAPVTENGAYTVEISNPNGKTAFSWVPVDCIDSDIPSMESFTVDERHVYICFTDSQSGMDWDSVYAVSEDGARVEPVDIRPDEELAVFEMPGSDIVVYVKDRAGNQAKSSIRTG